MKLTKQMVLGGEKKDTVFLVMEKHHGFGVFWDQDHGMWGSWICEKYKVIFLTDWDPMG